MVEQYVARLDELRSHNPSAEVVSNIMAVGTEKDEIVGIIAAASTDWDDVMGVQQKEPLVLFDQRGWWLLAAAFAAS